MMQGGKRSRVGPSGVGLLDERVAGSYGLKLPVVHTVPSRSANRKVTPPSALTGVLPPDQRRPAVVVCRVKVGEWLPAPSCVCSRTHTRGEPLRGVTSLDEHIKFSMTTCESCGGMRAYEQACPTCGRRPRPGEVNAPVVTRRQKMRAVSKLIEEMKSTEGSFDLSNPDTEVVARLSAFLDALGQTLAGRNSPDSARRLADAVLALEASAHFLTKAATVRPVARPRACLAIVRELQRLWPIYLDELTTSDVGRAERLAAEAQAVIDGSTRHLDELAIDLDATTRLGRFRDEPDLLARVFEAMRVKYPGTSLGGLIELGKSQSSLVDTELGRVKSLVVV